MKLEHSFEVAAPLERVWTALIDVEYVAPCLPGAEITGRDDDGAYRGTFTVKLGPTTAAYNGVLHIEDTDEAAHRATLHARGTDRRGQGAATATIVNTLTEIQPGTTRVEAVTDFTISGRLARFGRGGMMQDISARLLREFADCLQARLASGEDLGGLVELAGPAAAAPVAPGAETGSEAEPRRPKLAPVVPEAEVSHHPAPLSEGAGEAPVREGVGEAPVGEVADDAPAPVSPPPADTEPVQVESAASRQGSVAPPGYSPTPSLTPRPAPASRPPTPATKPVRGFSLFLSVLWGRVRARVRAMRGAR